MFPQEILSVKRKKKGRARILTLPGAGLQSGLDARIFRDVAVLVDCHQFGVGATAMENQTSVHEADAKELGDVSFVVGGLKHHAAIIARWTEAQGDIRFLFDCGFGFGSCDE